MSMKHVMLSDLLWLEWNEKTHHLFLWRSHTGSTKMPCMFTMYLLDLNKIQKKKQKLAVLKELRSRSWNPTVITQRSSKCRHAAVTAEALPLLETHTLVGTGVLLARSAGAWAWRQIATGWADSDNTSQYSL